MKIAVDAMGGDNAPEAVVKGSLEAVREYEDIELILTGPEDRIKGLMPADRSLRERLEIIDCQQVINMDEKPVKALRRKDDTSIGRAADLLHNEKAEALVSAGSTGASLAAGILKVGRIRGIKRPAIATLFPTKNEPSLILDMGANANCQPEYLPQYAIMGDIYARNILGRDNPRLGLMNVGEEKGKGHKMIDRAYELIEEDDRINNFAGNIEGRDIFTGEYDVILCDGFVGNVILKTVEGLGDFMFDLLKDALTGDMRSKLGAFLAKHSLKKMKDEVDYRQYGGAPMLGLKGIVIISHGSSDATAIKNAVRVARETAEQNIVEIIAREISEEGED